MYQLLLFVHIACAVVWVGGAVYAQLLAIRVGRSEDPTELPRLGRHFEFIGQRVFVPAAVVLFLAGAGLTVMRWQFTQGWIAIAIGLWLVSALAGSLYLGPRSKLAAELFEREGPTSVAGRRLLERLFFVSRLELVSFAVIIGLMVFKPGS
jgi:uncharacterized membrane protein